MQLDGSCVIDDGDVLDWVKSNYNPEDVFGNGELEHWAENNGYEKED